MQVAKFGFSSRTGVWPGSPSNEVRRGNKIGRSWVRIKLRRVGRRGTVEVSEERKKEEGRRGWSGNSRHIRSRSKAVALLSEVAVFAQVAVIRKVVVLADVAGVAGAAVMPLAERARRFGRRLVGPGEDVE